MGRTVQKGVIKIDIVKKFHFIAKFTLRVFYRKLGDSVVVLAISILLFILPAKNPFTSTSPNIGKNLIRR